MPTSNEMDEHDFEKMMGREPKPEEPPEEREAREARLGTPDATLGDIFHRDTLKRYAQSLGERRRTILEHFGLRDPADEEDGPSEEDFYEMLSEEQRKQYHKARNYYVNRRRATKNEEGSLLAFAATNPPEVLRRHLWRLQRGLEESLFGERPRTYPTTRVRDYQATLMVTLCDSCADELWEESEAEMSPPDQARKPGKRPKVSSSASARFHLMDRNYFVGMPFSNSERYLFRMADAYVEREVNTGLFGDNEFPYAGPKECQRCGTTDVDMWRERYGDK